MNSSTTPSRRILFVAPFGLRQKTTVWARTLPIARHLHARGHQVTILIPPWDSPQDAGRCWHEDGVELQHVALSGGLPATLWRMFKQIDLFRPDIVHIVKPRAHAGLVQWWLWQQRHRTPARRILLDTDDWEQAWNPINRYAWPIARFLTWQENWGICHAHAFTAASHWLVERISSAAPNRPILYLPNGLDTSIAAPTHHPAQINQVLYFTRFIEVSPTWLADFWRALQNLAPNTRLLIAGRGFRPEHEQAFRSELAFAPNAAKNEPGVAWLGYLPAATLPNLYAQVDCAIFPSQRTPLHEAKCSVRLATTLLHGVPVVASAVGEQTHYATAGAAMLVDADADPAQFASAVATLLANPATYRQQATAARSNLLATYDWNSLTGRLEAFYHQVAARP